MANIHQTNLLDKMADLAVSQKYADITIVSADDKIPVHRAIVLSISPRLAKGLEGGYQEATTQEIVMEQDSKTVRHMIDYMYTQDYKLDDKSSQGVEGVTGNTGDTRGSRGTNSTLKEHIKVWAIGDFSDVPTLRELAADKFKALINAEFECEGFADVVGQVYEHTPSHDSSLRDIVHASTAANADVLAADKNFIEALSTRAELQVYSAKMFATLATHYADRKAHWEAELAATNDTLKTIKSDLELSISLKPRRIRNSQW